MTFKLSPLPYPHKALEPHMSDHTLRVHHEKHHQGYVVGLNNLLKNHPLESASSLEEILSKAPFHPNGTLIFNNAAQVWNHDFFWQCLSPQGGERLLQGSLKKAIHSTFGDSENFFKAFKETALGQFGSGWVWLVINEKGGLAIQKTSNADLPLAHGLHPLITCDVWEHAYYLDYQNRRAEYVDTFLKHLANWSFAQERFENAV